MSLWSSLDAILDTWTDASAMRMHGVDLLVARLWREQHRAIPAALHEKVLAQTVVSMTAPAELACIRSVVEGPLVLIKGYDLAVRYPDPSLRPYWDFDILVRDADAAQNALLAAGCEPYAYGELEWAPDHHRTPLRWPGSILHIEVHEAPSWVDWQPRPPVDVFFDRTTDSPTGIDGIESLASIPYAIMIAAHAWHHGPLERLVQLIDFAVVAADCDPDELQRQADAWELGPVVRATRQAADAVFGDGCVRNPVIRRWVRHLRTGHKRGAMEHYLSVWFAGMWASTPRRRRSAVTAAIGTALRPRPGLTPAAHATRLARRMRHALDSASAYRNQPD